MARENSETATPTPPRGSIVARPARPERLTRTIHGPRPRLRSGASLRDASRSAVLHFCRTVEFSSCPRCGRQQKRGARPRFCCLARPERFELPTPKFVAWCSIQLSYGRVKGAYYREGVRVRQGTALPRAGRAPTILRMTQDRQSELSERTFRGGRLLAIIMSVVVALAVVSALVDWLVLGPLLERI